MQSPMSGSQNINKLFADLHLGMFEVVPVPEAGVVPLPLVQVVGRREWVEPEQKICCRTSVWQWPRPPELAHVVPAVCADHAHVLETEPHLHILRSLVILNLALAGVGQTLGGQSSQGLCRGKEMVMTSFSFKPWSYPWIERTQHPRSCSLPSLSR